MVAFSKLVVFRAASSLQGFSTDIRLMTLLGAVKSPSHNILTAVCDLPELQLRSSEWPLCWTLQHPPSPSHPSKKTQLLLPRVQCNRGCSEEAHIPNTVLVGMRCWGGKHTKPWLLQQQQWWGEPCF